MDSFPAFWQAEKMGKKKDRNEVDVTKIRAKHEKEKATHR